MALITRRSLVQIQAPLPKSNQGVTANSVAPFFGKILTPNCIPHNSARPAKEKPSECLCPFPFLPNRCKKLFSRLVNSEALYIRKCFFVLVIGIHHR
jgi:hypothetical protein